MDSGTHRDLKLRGDVSSSDAFIQQKPLLHWTLVNFLVLFCSSQGRFDGEFNLANSFALFYSLNSSDPVLLFLFFPALISLTLLFIYLLFYLPTLIRSLSDGLSYPFQDCTIPGTRALFSDIPTSCRYERWMRWGGSTDDRNFTIHWFQLMLFFFFFFIDYIHVFYYLFKKKLFMSMRFICKLISKKISYSSCKK